MFPNENLFLLCAIVYYDRQLRTCTTTLKTIMELSFFSY